MKRDREAQANRKKMGEMEQRIYGLEKQIGEEGTRLHMMAYNDLAESNRVHQTGMEPRTTKLWLAESYESAGKYNQAWAIYDSMTVEFFS
jgi:hypothetical protein